MNIGQVEEFGHGEVGGKWVSDVRNRWRGRRLQKTEEIHQVLDLNTSPFKVLFYLF
jgi:hypothetical protein